MTITQLEYIISIAKCGNFTLAAEECFVTQPTLSMQVQKLEEELGGQIFNRNTKPIQPTSLGEKIIPQAKKILEESLKIKDISDQVKGYVGGDFKLGIIPTVSPTLLPIFLNTFLKKYPNVSLKIEETTTKNFMEQILAGKLDAGIGATPLSNDKLIESALYYEPFVAYVPDHHHLSEEKQLDVADLESSKVLILEDGHCFRDQALSLCDIKSHSKNFEIKSGSFETMINLADEGLGMTLLPYLHSILLSKDKQSNIRYFQEPSPAREISLIHHKSFIKFPIINALFKTIESVIRGVIKFENVKIIPPK